MYIANFLWKYSFEFFLLFDALDLILIFFSSNNIFFFAFSTNKAFSIVYVRSNNCWWRKALTRTIFFSIPGNLRCLHNVKISQFICYATHKQLDFVDRKFRLFSLSVKPVFPTRCAFGFLRVFHSNLFFLNLLIFLWKYLRNIINFVCIAMISLD